MDFSSPRTALELVDPPAPPPPHHSFCSRCGTPAAASHSPGPRGASLRSPVSRSRVCGHCGMGLILRTTTPFPAGAPFVICDRSRVISAVSRSAERLLGAPEERLLGTPLAELRVPVLRRATCEPPPGTLLLLAG